MIRRRHAPGRVLIIVQNLPVPLDRRVWLECLALRKAGYQVSVICPKGPGDPSYQQLEGVSIRKYTPPPVTNGFAAYAWEFLYCWVMTAWLTLRTAFREGFDVIQACNPPDTFFALAALFKPFGKKFVFDQHDLCPEVYESRFSDGPKLFHRGLLALERGTYLTADHVISTNESYRDTAIRRGRQDPGSVTVVRTGPDAAKLRRGEPSPDLRQGRDLLCAYLGVMGPQDGVDLALEAAAVIVHDMARRDIQFVFVGGGDSYDDLTELATDLKLDEYVTFTGRVPDATVFDVLSTADVGLCPDPLNSLNDVSTMNKTMEYMAFELPVVAFDLRETKVSAAEAALYVTPNDVREYAETIVKLLDDPGLRQEMGRAGRTRVEDTLAWEHQAPIYVGVYDRLFGS